MMASLGRSPLRNLVLLLLNTTCFLSHGSSAQIKAVIIKAPLSVNTTIATKSITLSCEVFADTVVFVIDGTSANLMQTLGFEEHPIEILSDGIKSRILTVTPSLEISNSQVVCQAINQQGPSDNPLSVTGSQPAILRVQGALDPPKDVKFSIIKTAVRLSWTPPQTLLGTNINGYYVYSTTGDTKYTEFDEVTLPITNPDPCGYIKIFVTPYNGINGTAAEVGQIVLPSIPKGSISVSTYIINKSQKIVNMTIGVNVTNLCLGEYPESVSIYITSSGAGPSNVYSNTAVLSHPISGNGIMYTNIISLVATQRYFITVIPRNALGDFDISEIQFPVDSSASATTPTIRLGLHDPATTAGTTAAGSDVIQGSAIGIGSVLSMTFLIFIILLIIFLCKKLKMLNYIWRQYRKYKCHRINFCGTTVRCDDQTDVPAV